MSVSYLALVMMAVLILIPILAGILVYKDARARRMDAVLWTLMSVLIPFIGLFTYLLIRNNDKNPICSNCHNPVANEYLLCPFCGQYLKASCPSCLTPVESEWKLCPQCGTELPLCKDNLPFQDIEWLRERARHDEVQALHHSKVTIAKNLLDKKMPVYQIVDVTGLTQEEVEVLREND